MTTPRGPPFQPGSSLIINPLRDFGSSIRCGLTRRDDQASLLTVEVSRHELRPGCGRTAS